nr:cell wall protein DAN4-like isoform X3 [Crassostrea gigas]
MSNNWNGGYTGNQIPVRYAPPNWRKILTGEMNVDDDSSISSTSSPKRTTTRGNSRSRKTCVTTTLVGIVLVLLLLGASCVPLILYFVEKDQSKYYKADGSITFQGTYNESLGDLSTQTSIDFQQDFCQVMEQTQANKFKDSYSGCLVTQIKDGSIIVEFTMYYIAKVTVQLDEVKAEIIINLKTNLTKTFSSKFSITVDVNSLTVSLLQTGETDYQSATSDSRFQTSLLSSTTEGTISTLLPTISSNTDNSTTTEVTTILPETTTTVPPETTTTVTPTTTTIATSETTTIYTTSTVLPETTTIDTSTTTTTAHTQTTTTTHTPATTTTAETTTTGRPTTTTSAPPETTITDTSTTTTTVPPETTTTDTSSTTTSAPPETTTTDTSTTTTTAPPETTTTDASTTTTTAPPETTITDTSTTTTTAPPETTTTDNDTTTAGITAATSMPVEPFAVVDMMNSIGEIGKQAYIPCTINITSGDWVMIYIYQTHKDSIEPKIATITKNGTITIFTSDPLLMPTFNISGSQIEAVVTFNFSNYDFSNCSVRLYRFTCSVEMTTGSTFNASAELNLIAPLIQPTVTLHRTQYMFNKTANVSLAGINATCNATQDRSSDYSFTIAMRIQNVSGDDIDSLAEVNSYNVSTETCGELVFINWSDVFIYRADLNGSSLTCYIKSNDRTVTSENITLTFVEQQMPP